MRGRCTLENIHPNLSIRGIVKTYFFGNSRNDPSDVVDLRICDRFPFFYRKSANLNLKSAICGFADLRTGLRKCPALKILYCSCYIQKIFCNLMSYSVEKRNIHILQAAPKRAL